MIAPIVALIEVIVDFKYDSRNRLIQVGEITYEYDAENNRIAKVEKGIRTTYVVNTNATYSQTLIEKDDNNNEKYFIYGNLLIGKEDQDGNYLSYHFDKRGSTSVLTNISGNVIERFNYGPYGELIGNPNLSLTSFLYNREYGVTTDNQSLYYMRARYYNTEIKRFINQDILLGNVVDSTSMNRYSYVSGNPVTLIDPFGLAPEGKINLFVHTVC